MLSEECVETVKLCGREDEYTVPLHSKGLKIIELQKVLLGHLLPYDIIEDHILQI